MKRKCFASGSRQQSLDGLGYTEREIWQCFYFKKMLNESCYEDVVRKLLRMLERCCGGCWTKLSWECCEDEAAVRMLEGSCHEHAGRKLL